MESIISFLMCSSKSGMAEHMVMSTCTSSALGSGMLVLKASKSVLACGVKNVPGGFGALVGAGVIVMQGLCLSSSVKSLNIT